MEDGVVLVLLAQDERGGGASGLEGSGHSEDPRRLLAAPTREPGTPDREGTAGRFEAEVGVGEAVDDVATGEPLTEVGDVRLGLLGLGVRGRGRRRREEVVGGRVGGIDEHRGLVRGDCGPCKERIAGSRRGVFIAGGGPVCLLREG